MKRVSCDFPLSLNTGRGYMGWVLEGSLLLKQTLPAASGWRTRPHQPWRRTDRRHQSPASEPQGRLSRRSANTHSHAAHIAYSVLGPFVYIYGRVRKADVIFLVQKKMLKSNVGISTKVLFKMGSIWWSYRPRQGPGFEKQPKSKRTVEMSACVCHLDSCLYSSLNQSRVNPKFDVLFKSARYSVFLYLKLYRQDLTEEQRVDRVDPSVYGSPKGSKKHIRPLG